MKYSPDLKVGGSHPAYSIPSIISKIQILIFIFKNIKIFIIPRPSGRGKFRYYIFRYSIEKTYFYPIQFSQFNERQVGPPSGKDQGSAKGRGRGTYPATTCQGEANRP